MRKARPQYCRLTYDGLKIDSMPQKVRRFLSRRFKCGYIEHPWPWNQSDVRSDMSPPCMCHMVVRSKPSARSILLDQPSTRLASAQSGFLRTGSSGNGSPYRIRDALPPASLDTFCTTKLARSMIGVSVSHPILMGPPPQSLSIKARNPSTQSLTYWKLRVALP
jgi:hypothetical protein